MKKLNLPLFVGMAVLLTDTSAQSQTPSPGPADSAPLVVQWVRTPGDHAPTRIIRVPAHRTLARVNDKAITLSALLPVGERPANAAYMLSPENYAALLDRSIERELIQQMAQAEGLVLSADQQRARDHVRERLLATEGAPGEVIHLNRVGTLEDEITFEQRDATSQLLLNSLLERAGVNGPHLTADRVQKHYERNRGHYPPLPAAATERARAWQPIDFAIRQQLASTAHAEYVEARKQWLTRLKSSATITMAQTVEANPQLSVRFDPAARAVVVSWSDTATVFALQEATSLAPSAVWTDLTTPVATAEGLKTVTVPLVTPARFYRLRQP